MPPQQAQPQPLGPTPGMGQPLPPPPGVPQPAVAPGQPGMVPVHAPAATVQPAVPAQPPPLPDGSACRQHTTVAAVCRCSKCANPACTTCAFWLPDGLVLCPDCVVAADSSSGLSGRRKLAVWWSLGLAIFATSVPLLGLLATLGLGGDEEQAAAIAGVAVVVLGFFPALVGMGLGAGAIRWGKKNPALPWVGLIWNAVIVTPILFLILIGAAMA